MFDFQKSEHKERSNIKNEAIKDYRTR